jgi:hypothetical protein
VTMDGAPRARRRQPWSSGPRRRRRTPPSASEVDLCPSRRPSSALHGLFLREPAMMADGRGGGLPPPLFAGAVRYGRQANPLRHGGRVELGAGGRLQIRHRPPSVVIRRIPSPSLSIVGWSRTDRAGHRLPAQQLDAREVVGWWVGGGAWWVRRLEEALHHSKSGGSSERRFFAVPPAGHRCGLLLLDSTTRQG